MLPLKFYSIRNWLLIISIFMIVFPCAPQAENSPISENQKTVAKDEQEQPSYQQLNQFILDNLESEQRNIENLKEALGQVKSLRNSLKTDLNAYRIQLSTYGNLLVVPTTRIQDLEKALASTQTSIQAIDALLNDLNPELEHYTLLLQQTLEQQALNKKQLSQINTEAIEDEKNEELVSQIGKFAELFLSKEKLLADLIQEYTEEIQSLLDIKTPLQELAIELDREIKTRKKAALFKREQMPLISTQWLEITKELTDVKEQMLEMRSKNFWLTELYPVFKNGFYIRLFAFLILSLIIISILLRTRRYCGYLRRQPECQTFPWRWITLGMIQRSILLFGITLFLTMYVQLRHLQSISLFQLGFNILWIWIFSKWGFDFPVLFNQIMPNRIPPALSFRIYFLILLIRIFALSHVLIGWFMPETGMVLFTIRLLLEILLIIWMISFVHHLKLALTGTSLHSSRYFPGIRLMIFTSIYIVISGAPLLELAGYGTLAHYWYLSWSRTSIVLIWSILFYFLLKEWHDKINEQTDESTLHRSRTKTLQWLMFKFCWLAWLLSLCLGILFAWGARQTVIINIIDIFLYPVPLGAVTLSLAGFLNAFFVLFFTQIVIRLWRHLLHKKILPQSGIEIGLQESIITITSYILWSLGILMALYAFGLNMTSIAVAFGALGIGLGFGLQNIFNNFISGIILLFERPIQVGDDVEINGIWATVKKINVRSTIVQTYDNAALIIPNSNFISNQVTNWSFKDKSVRRQISVGVAYGSDVEQVRDSLIEVANQTPNVFKYPKPDVLFVDFADSALVFKLRLWTDLDHMLKVDTAIRFGIDRLFRERNITIAFPQCDVHLFQETPHTNSFPASPPKEEPLLNGDKNKI